MYFLTKLAWNIKEVKNSVHSKCDVIYNTDTPSLRRRSLAVDKAKQAL